MSNLSRRSLSGYPVVLLIILCLGWTLPNLSAHDETSGFAPKKVGASNDRLDQDAQTASPVTDGLWTTLPYPMPLNPIHCGLLHTGKVVVVAGSENDPSKHKDGQYLAAVWDPQTGLFNIQNLLWDVFCNGMATMPDGRWLIVGGSEALSPPYGDFRATIFDPATEKFNQVESMEHGRWYATVTELSDGGLMAFSGIPESGYGDAPPEGGRGRNEDVEIYHVGSGWGPEYEAPWTPPLYPRLHLLPNGKVFCSGEQISSNIFDPESKTWALNVATTIYSKERVGGTSVLLPLRPSNGYVPRVMILGGDHIATATTELIDLSATTPAWRMLPPMAHSRTRMNAVLLPTGKVLALGGSSLDEDPNTASLATDLFDPATETWSSAGVAVYPRLYHSCALLLPDATVWVVGSNPKKGTYEQNIELYTPAYLFTSDANGNVIPARRPTITSAPAEVGYGTTFAVSTPDAPEITQAVLVRPGSSTHSFDFEQRVVELSFTASSAGTLTPTAPPSGSIAPPGYYMLFLINSTGVPSVAKFIHLTTKPNDLPPKGSITTPTGDITIEPGATVSFAGSATDPDGTVASYSWNFPGGNPGTSSGSVPAPVTFSDAGTYVVSMTALDDSGVNDPSPPTRKVTVKLGTLQLSFLAPEPGAIVSGRKIHVDLSAAGTAGTSNTFTLSVDGTVVASTTGRLTTANLIWVTRRYSKGPHTLSATIVDGEGNSASASETVTLQ